MYALDDVAVDRAAFRQAIQENLAYRPLYVKLKLVWTCNLRCGMCNHWREDRGQPLPLENFIILVDDLVELGCRKIHISGGEPTLYPQLPELIAHMTKHGLRVNMTTNGTLITTERARNLARAGLRGVNVSIDSPERRLHDRMRGQKGAWKRAVKGARRLRKRLRKKGRIRINTVVGRMNYHSLVNMPEIAADIGADFLNLIPLDDHTGQARRLNKRMIADYNANVGPIIAEKGLALGLLQHPQQAFPFGLTRQDLNLSRDGHYALGYYENNRCFAPWTHTLINHHGQVTICCMMRDAPVVGDLHQNSFAEIWRGPVYTALRSRSELPFFETCRRCDDFLVENRKMAQILQLKSENKSASSSS